MKKVKKKTKIEKKTKKKRPNKYAKKKFIPPRTVFGWEDREHISKPKAKILENQKNH